VQLTADEFQQYRAALVEQIRAKRALVQATLDAARVAVELTSERVHEVQAALTATHGVDFAQNWRLEADGRLVPA
jgi:hypothetical protein